MAEKFELRAEDAAALSAARQAAVVNYMDRERPPANLVGFGVGVRYRRGEPTGEKAVLALVERKVEPGDLMKEDLLPGEFDVLEVGRISAFATTTIVTTEPAGRAAVAAPAPDGMRLEALPAPVPAAPPMAPPALVELRGPGRLRNKMRPCEGGFSIGHYRGVTGTMSTAVYDILPGGSVSPPRPGFGIPHEFYVLSTNHVLANSNQAHIGDPILQPGPANGGQLGVDQIASLHRFVPIDFFPWKPLQQHNNIVDCAIGRGELQDLDREVYWSGEVRGWRLKRQRAGYPTMPVRVGEAIQKTGMSTGWTSGVIMATDVTLDVDYATFGRARFREQFLAWNNPFRQTAIAEYGDSGSLVLDMDNVAVGLLFAGSDRVTLCNQIENVRAQLRVEIAQRIL
ncbi:MAG TPA: hypothetical protein VGO86_14655 [Candidatus Dormibacteraeota bacterium]